jgi:hypothetical protein
LQRIADAYALQGWLKCASFPGWTQKAHPARKVFPHQQIILVNPRSEIESSGSCKEPGFIVDAVRDGALVGYSI